MTIVMKGNKKKTERPLPVVYPLTSTNTSRKGSQNLPLLLMHVSAKRLGKSHCGIDTLLNQGLLCQPRARQEIGGTCNRGECEVS